MIVNLWSSAAWVAAACGLGFATTVVFSSWLKLSRNLFLIPYVALASAFLISFFALNKIDIGAMLKVNWIWGLVAGALVSIFLVFNVRSQPKSRKSRGGELVMEAIWAGIIYGLVDALYLSVLPVVAIDAGTSRLAWASTSLGRVAVGGIGLLASLIVSVTYHIGYKEFQGKKIIFTILGPGLITLGFLISGNPLGSVISHPVMHIAAVLRGPETTVQLPPHTAS